MQTRLANKVKTVSHSLRVDKKVIYLLNTRIKTLRGN